MWKLVLKDNVNMGMLERYGFKLNNRYYYKLTDKNVEIIINIENREVFVHYDDSDVVSNLNLVGIANLNSEITNKLLENKIFEIAE